eukprot:CAMPEP_0206579008 /NCGR_PEP_ID=MMETSP0325_2-20121206/32296_1 /ASSEMBLY_ACC=CAM_ASM_000347 /TAXON_ID=2866 /ORGANISM="Crypthecodinium cohnii, Strain Seligo" /LENGTH=173 /DNA_ID=CAMNT_0054084743 /DNA_START=368 /DNA_END=886 /DNA_ORIENTATION=+
MMFDDTPTVIQDLSQDGPYTLFCPTDAAMDLVKEDAWENLFDEEKALFMRHHAVRGKWGIEDIAAAAGKPTRPVDYVDLTTYERPGPYNKAFFAEPLKAPMLSLADQKLEVEVTGELKDMNRIVKVGGAQIVKSNTDVGMAMSISSTGPCAPSECDQLLRFPITPIGLYVCCV